MIECPYVEEYEKLLGNLSKTYHVVCNRKPYRNETNTRWLLNVELDGRVVKYYFSEAQGKWRKK